MMAWLGIIITGVILVIVSGMLGFFFCACFSIDKRSEEMATLKENIIQKIKEEVADTEECRDVIIDIIIRS